MRTGSIVDFYDDPQGSILKEKVARADIPPFIKEAAHLNEDVRAALPDDVFALVAIDGTHKLRKFACVDKGNTSLSVIYFLENKDKLPEEAQKVAAANLVTACGWYDIEPPEPLLKVAGKVGDAIKTLTPKKLDVKTLAPQKIDIKKTAASDSYKKLASIQPYVNITGQQPPPRFEKRAHSHFCLVKEGQGRFPIDDYGQVLDANRWFEEHGTSLHPEDRRAYCTKLAARADELGIAVTDRVRKYGGEDYAPDGEIKVAVSTRMQFWADDSPERDMLNGLMDKYASVTPDVFCESLRQFDEMTGMHHYWDDGIYDPWYSTYGFNKEAMWSWEDGNDRLTAEEFHRGLHESTKAIKERFGEDFVDELIKEKDPTIFFDSLPLDHKRILARIISDH